jgi:hypothetical protein
MSNNPAVLAQGITEKSILDYINMVEPFLADIKKAYEEKDLQTKKLKTAEAMIKYNFA